MRTQYFAGLGAESLTLKAGRGDFVGIDLRLQPGESMFEPFWIFGSIDVALEAVYAGILRQLPELIGYGRTFWDYGGALKAAVFKEALAVEDDGSSFGAERQKISHVDDYAEA